MSETLEELLHFASSFLADAELYMRKQSPHNARRDAEVLVGAVTGKSRAELLAHRDSAVPAEVRKVLLPFLERRRSAEPIAYILGQKEFYGRDFLVGRGVLIPRPETELLVERALAWFSHDCPEVDVVDIGVGSGAILVSVVCELCARWGDGFVSHGHYVGRDISEAALEFAKRNAEKHHVAHLIEFQLADTLSNISWKCSAPQRLVLSNPPYIPEGENLPPEAMQYEPALALHSGEKGLDMIEKILDQTVPDILMGERLILEIGYDQKALLESALLARGLRQFVFHRDLQGYDRVVEVVG